MTPFAAKTHPGCRRERNEDRYLADPDLALWVVADGVGGHSHGDVAANIACSTIRKSIAAGASLRASIDQAHHAILEEIARRGASENMGTTVVAVRFTDADYELAWVGDSRAYLARGSACAKHGGVQDDGDLGRKGCDDLQQITTDHSAVTNLVESGVITPEQAGTHPQRNALSRSLGVSTRNQSEADVITGTLQAGEQLLLCTDGLTDELSDASILRELRRSADVHDQVESLVARALESGGRDNITVVLLGEAPALATVPQHGHTVSQDLRAHDADRERQRAPKHRKALWVIAGVLVVAVLAWFLSQP